MASHLFVILIGLRGSGKSTLARALGSRLSWPALDLDDLVAQDMGQTHAGECIRTRGIDAFRRAEASVLERVLRTTTRPTVLALGGGTPTAPGAADTLRHARQTGRALIVYLRASESELRSRLASDTRSDRPSLTGAGTLDEIGPILNDRDPLYRQLADLTIESGGLTPDQVADAILARG